MSRRWVLGVFTVLVVCGCGGGSRPPGQAPASSIGSAGGTVTGPSGAQVVIPAGALSAPALIGITESSTGAPALPTGVVPFGPMFAFTPHGTSFAVPATMTVPFDPALVPSGAQPALYKTNATMTGWDELPVPTVTGNAVSASVTGFSFAVVGVRRSVDLVVNVRKYFFSTERPDGTSDKFGENSQSKGALDQHAIFGVAPVKPYKDQPVSRGEVFSSATGTTYGVLGEAPGAAEIANNEPNSSFTSLKQFQVFQKNAADAELSLTIKDVILEMLDGDPAFPTPGQCPAFYRFHMPEDFCNYVMVAEVSFDARVTNLSTGHTILHTSGTARLDGWRAHWRKSAWTDHGSTVRLWDDDTIALDPDVGANTLQDHSRVILLREIPVAVPLQHVGVGEQIRLVVTVTALTSNDRQGESYIGAYLVDPQQIGGFGISGHGLLPLETPLDDPPTPDDDPVAPPCPGGSVPDAGTISLDGASFSVPERGAGGGVVTITRSGGSQGDVSATLTLEDGTAIAGRDYQPASVNVFFADGEMGSRAFAIPVINNNSLDVDRTLGVKLSAPMGCAALGERTEAVVTIVDDDRETPVRSTFTVGGAVTGLQGSGLAVSDHLGAGAVSPTADGTFVLPAAVLDGTPYDVRVDVQPTNPLQVCTIAHGTGTVSGANVTDVTVTCTTPPPPGGLDPSFGEGGRAVTNVGYSPNLLRSRVGMALQSDGKILLVGGLKLVRLNSDGTPDSTFGTAGVVDVVFGNGAFDTAMDVVVQADGKIVVAGSTGTAVTGSDDFALTRFDSRGRLDTTFGTAGHVTTDFFASSDEARRMIQQPDGKILVVGFAVHLINPSQGSTLFAIARYTADGVLDTTFAITGRTSDSPGQVQSFASGLAIQSDGKIVVVGSTAPNGGDNPDTGVVRYLGDGQVKLPGTRDESFGPKSDGTMDAPMDQSVDVVVLDDGTILTAVQVDAGLTGSGGSGFGLGRIPASGVPPPRGPQGIVTFTTQSDFPHAMLQQTDGKIVVVGLAGGFSTNPDMAIVRFNEGGGAPDTTFGTDGKKTIDFFGAIDSAEAVVQQPDRKLVIGGFARNGSGSVLVAVRLMP